MREERRYFHLFANGDDAKGFIISEEDFIFEFNAIAICAYESGVTVVCFSLEDTHPHILLYGTEEQCNNFLMKFEDISLRHIYQTRGSLDGVTLHCELYQVDDADYLMNVGVYVTFQATKDGKPVMHYDYRWGTGSMYFREQNHIPIWLSDTNGTFHKPQKFSELTARAKRSLCGRHSIPDEWMVCDGLILPDNYIDIKKFESIYHTHNCFRTFMSSGKNKDAAILQGMATSRGVLLEDLEARRIAENVCYELFRKKTSRWLDTNQRLQFAMELNRRFRLTHRQISTIARLPEAEICKYVK